MCIRMCLCVRAKCQDMAPPIFIVLLYFRAAVCIKQHLQHEEQLNVEALNRITKQALL
uniref:Uncharacterized protein n=1 Tax=Anguilla anguilla TaxID=7936 RepID=A0A0E9PIB0_ANGAN